VSAREAAARLRAVEQHRRRRARLRPLGWLAIAIVVVPAINDHPAPALSGEGLGVALALAAFAAAVGSALVREHDRGLAAVGAPVVAGAAGLVLAGLQPHGLVEVAPAIAVWMLSVRLPLRTAVPAAAAVIVGLDIVIAFSGVRVGESIAASTLLCLVLVASGDLMRQATESRNEIDVLLARLEDAREAELEATALAERSRIARELHDVLAHSLSALSIQLEGARLLAVRDGAEASLAAAIARAGELARGGLDDARRAVEALREGGTPTLDDLPRLVESFRALDLNVTLTVDGAPRPLPAEGELAVFRAAQEALTNVLRYAREGRATVRLSYGETAVRLVVEDELPVAAGGSPSFGGGGGKGLTGMRERVEAAGGRVRAGGTARGFRVDVEVPV